MSSIASADAARLATRCIKCGGPVCRSYALVRNGGRLCRGCYVTSELVRVETPRAKRPLPPCTYPGCTEIPWQQWELGRCGKHVVNRLADTEET